MRGSRPRGSPFLEHVPCCWLLSLALERHKTSGGKQKWRTLVTVVSLEVYCSLVGETAGCVEKLDRVSMFSEAVNGNHFGGCIMCFELSFVAKA